MEADEGYFKENMSLFFSILTVFFKSEFYLYLDSSFFLQSSDYFLRILPFLSQRIFILLLTILCYSEFWLLCRSHLILPLKPRSSAVPSLSCPRRQGFCPSTHILTQGQNTSQQPLLLCTWPCRCAERVWSGTTNSPRPPVVSAGTWTSFLVRKWVGGSGGWRRACHGEWGFLWNKGFWRRFWKKQGHFGIWIIIIAVELWFILR